MIRPSLDTYFINIAGQVSTRSTCLRRKVGAVLVDENKHILSTGYNGKPRGFPNCTDGSGGLGGCIREKEQSGVNLDICLVVHAEQNALLQCSDVNKISSIYCTTFPCIQCIKLLMNTSCRNIMYKDEYDKTTDELINLWVNSGVWLGRAVGKIYV